MQVVTFHHRFGRQEIAVKEKPATERTHRHVEFDLKPTVGRKGRRSWTLLLVCIQVGL